MEESVTIYKKMIIWDFDGTIADSSKDVWTSLYYAAEKMGGKIRDNFSADDQNLSLDIKDIYQEIFPDESMKKLQLFSDLVSVHYRQMNPFEKTIPYKGIKDTVTYLKAIGYRQFIATMKPKEPLEKIVKQWGWMNFFDGIITSDFYPDRELSKKEMIGLLLTHYSLSAEDCLIVGDSSSDIYAAKHYGIFSIGVAYGDGNTERLKKSNPNILLKSSAEIEVYFKGGLNDAGKFRN